MVVFTCGHCGESVQKPKVEKHYLTKCRNRDPNLSCMDCFKDFLGNAYESHTKCITEEERYSGKGFMAKEKKGERKQNTWVEMLQSVLDEQKNAPRNVLRIVETVSKHNNTPRKKPKFINFVKNVCGPKTNPKDIDQAWDMISVKLAALSAANQNRNQNQPKKSEVNGDDNDGSVNEKNEKEEEKNSEELNISTEDQNGDSKPEDHVNGEVNEEENANKKLTKKQRKEEKKRKKYEAELQSAVEPPPEEEEVQDAPTKKGKKKKSKSESSMNGNVEEAESEEKNKNKKRKRQDTVNSVPEAHDNDADNIENIPVTTTTKVSKKKLKVQVAEEQDESICLHDQNVAKIGELTMNSEQFNWHATIMSVLEKKGPEVPFKRLQKKVLMAYSEATGQEVDDRIADKFIKKLKSAPNVRVDKNRVLLLE